jgi:very-short-patch-repair endonuclease
MLLDLGQHVEQQEYDEERTKYLELEGFRTIRFWNKDVMKDMDNVILAIIHAMEGDSKKD